MGEERVIYLGHGSETSTERIRKSHAETWPRDFDNTDAKFPRRKYGFETATMRLRRPQRGDIERHYVVLPKGWPISQPLVANLSLISGHNRFFRTRGADQTGYR